VAHRRLAQARGDTRILQYWTEIRRAVEDFEPWAADRIREMPSPPEESQVLRALNFAVSRGAVGQVNR